MFSLADYFLPDTQEVYKKSEYLNKVLNMCLDFYSGTVRNNKVIDFQTPQELMDLVSEKLPEDTSSLETTFEILEKIGKYSIAQFDKNFLAFPDSGNCLPALAGSVYSTFLNQNLIAFDRSAPVGTFIEIQLIEWFRELVGYDVKNLDAYKNINDMGGLWTSGGHMSNHIAVLSALNYTFPEVKNKGLRSLKTQPVLVQANEIAHYSHTDALAHLGIGLDNVVSVNTNDDYSTDFNHLDELLSNPKSGTKPFMVTAVAGNCRTCTIDNLDRIAEVCKNHSIWFHVDACHGGSLIFSDKLRSTLLKGIEFADSISIDPHKGLFVPYPCSYVLFKKRGELINYARYPELVLSGNVWNIGYISPFFGSRGFNSLPIYMAIKVLGKNGIQRIVETREETTTNFGIKVSNSKYFFPLHEASFYRQAFVYITPKVRDYIHAENRSLNDKQRKDIMELVNFYTHKVNNFLYMQGSVVFDEFKLRDLGNRLGLGTTEKYIVMSWSIGNPLITEESLDKSMETVLKVATSFEEEMNNGLNNMINNTCSRINTIGNFDAGNSPASW